MVNDASRRNRKGPEPNGVIGTDSRPSCESPPAAWYPYVLRTREGAIYTGIATGVSRRTACKGLDSVE